MAHQQDYASRVQNSYGMLRAGCEGHQSIGCRCESMSGFKQPSGDAAGAATKLLHVRSYCSGCATMPATNHVLICDSDLKRENAISDGRREPGPDDVICRWTMEVKGVLELQTKALSGYSAETMKTGASRTGHTPLTLLIIDSLPRPHCYSRPPPGHPFPKERGEEAGLSKPSTIKC